MNRSELPLAHLSLAERFAFYESLEVLCHDGPACDPCLVSEVVYWAQLVGIEATDDRAFTPTTPPPAVPIAPPVSLANELVMVLARGIFGSKRVP